MPKKNHKRTFVYKKNVFHFIFWIVNFVLVYFGNYKDSYSEILIPLLILAFVFIAGYYISDDFLIKEKVLSFLVKGFSLIGLSIFLLYYLNRTTVLDYQYLVFALCTLNSFIFSVFYKDYSYMLENKERIATLIKEKNDFELNMLKSQFSPHFLFNTLNSIYSKCHDSSPEAAKMIHSLSDFMRYLINECSQERVLLHREVLMIHNFINLYKLNHQNKINVTFKHKLYDDLCTIAPMILLNFIENAFKHSNVASSEDSYVEIELVTDQKWLYFKVKNNKVAILNRLEKGVGNKNTITRLDLDYKNRYTYQVMETDKEYEIDLRIRLL